MSILQTLARRVLTTVCVVLVGALFSKCAQATTINGLGGASIEYVTGGVRIADGSGLTFQGRTWENPVNRTSPLRINEQLRIGSVGGRALAINSARTIGAAAVGSAALQLGAAAWGGWQIGSALADYLGLGDASGGTRLAPCGSSWCYDEGAPGVGGTVQQWRYSFSSLSVPATTANTLPSVAEMIAAVSADPYCPSVLDRLGYPGHPNCTSSGWSIAPPYTQSTPNPSGTGGGVGFCVTLNYPGGTQTSCGTLYAYLVDVDTEDGVCEPYIDALNPAFSNLAPVKGSDGKCPTGRYGAVSLETARAKLGTGATFPEGVNITAADRLAEDILNKGGVITGASERTVSGPASISGTPQVTTENKPDGSTVTTTKTPTTNYTYGGNTINYTTTVVTTINNAGDVTTVTTNTPGSHEAPDVECEKNPGTVGCMKPGELPTDAPTWQTR